MILANLRDNPNHYVLYVEGLTPGTWTEINSYLDPIKAIQGFTTELEHNRGAANPMAVRLDSPTNKDILRNHG